MSQMEVDWLALTPPDRTSVTYHLLSDSLESMSGPTADRGIMWEVPDRVQVLSDTGDNAQVEWAVEAILYLRASGRSRRALRNAIAAEGALLMRAVEARTAWPVGVLAVESGDVSTEIDEESGDALLSLGFRAFVSEPQTGVILPPTFDPTGSLIVETSAASYNVLSTTRVVLLTGTNQAIRLPTGTAHAYRRITIADKGLNGTTTPHLIEPAMGETIMGLPSISLDLAGQSLEFTYNLADWTVT